MNEHSKHIDSLETKNNQDIHNQSDLFEKGIVDLRKEFNELSTTTKDLVKSVYDLGKTLKDKVSKRELNKVKEKIEAWELEDYISHDELKNNFKEYSKS
jgi:hypothetical protein